MCFCVGPVVRVGVERDVPAELPSSDVGTPRIRGHTASRAHEERALRPLLNRVDLPRGHHEDLLRGVIDLRARHPKATEVAPHEAEVLVHERPHARFSCDGGRHLCRRARHEIEEEEREGDAPDPAAIGEVHRPGGLEHLRPRDVRGTAD